MTKYILFFMLICGVCWAEQPTKQTLEMVETQETPPIIIDGRYGDLGRLVLQQEERLKNLENTQDKILRHMEIDK